MLVRSASSRVVLGVLAGALAAGLLAVLLFGALVRAGEPAGMTGPLADGGWTARSRAWFTVSGIYPSEVHADGLHYTWTSSGVRFVMPHLDRSVAHTLTFNASARRPADVALPAVTWSVDGAPSGTPLSIGNDFAPIAIDLPARPIDRAVVTMQIAQAWDPGPEDDRQLGVFVRDVTLTRAAGKPAPVWRVTGMTVASVALLVLPLWVSGLPRVLIVVGSAGVATALAWLGSLDGAFLGPFPGTLNGIAVVVGPIAAMVVGLLRVVERRSERPFWAAAVAVVSVATAVKLALFAHPLAIVGDGVFQVHRAQLVAAGQYFFTSITPRPFFEFPYAIALYVAAMPFWSWVPRELDRVWLLRAVALAADALVGIALAGVVRAAWDSRRAALFVALLWPFARAPFEALSNANLTNAFGQSVFAVAMAGLAWRASTRTRGLAVALVAGGILSIAFLSHFSTLSVGIPLVGIVAVSLMMLGSNEARWQGIRIAFVLAAAVAIAYAAYYRHFGEVYAKTIDRVMTEQPVDTTRSSIAASPWVKLYRWATVGSDDYGLPGVSLGLAALAGAFGLARRRPREPWTLVLAGWLAAWIAFTALGILTSIQMRVNLAAAPLFVCLGAYGLTALSRRSAAMKAVAVLIVLFVVWDGVRLWRICMGQ